MRLCSVAVTRTCLLGRQMSQSKTLSRVLRGLEEGGTCRFAAVDRGRRRRGLWPQLFDVEDPYQQLVEEDSCRRHCSVVWWQARNELAYAQDLPVTSAAVCGALFADDLIMNCCCHDSWADTLIRMDYSVAKPTTIWYIYRVRQKKCIHTLTKENSTLYNRLL